jgi:RNA polymerase sigma factor (TIGR02999 family)
MTPSDKITAFLTDLHNGDENATSRLMPLVYAELRRIAAACFAHERPGHTLQPTAVVHEMYARLIKPRAGPWKSRAHFFAIASRAMRQVLVDHARAHHAKKRGASVKTIDLAEAIAYSPERSTHLIKLDETLHRLEELSPRQGRIVELRFFGGLTIKETAVVLGVGVTQVKEDWTLAKAWLQRELGKNR